MKEISSDIDFADSKYENCRTNGSNLMIHLTSWDDRTIKIIFSNTIQFLYRGGSIISGVYEDVDGSPFLLEALSSYYGNAPKNHPFKRFLIVDIEESPLFEVVAQNVFISLVPKEGLSWFD